jgi:hypothetical protein
LRKLTSLSDKLTLRTHDIDKDQESARAMGIELAALVQTLIDASRGSS